MSTNSLGNAFVSRLAGRARVCFALAVAITWVSFGSFADSFADAASMEVFKTPSGNISCAYIPPPISTSAVMTCEVRSYSGKVATRPKDCDLDWVPTATVDKFGKVSTWSCQGDTLSSPDANALAYGATWKRGVFTCVSSISGVRCSHKNGHGFTVSRSAIAKF